MLAQFVKGLSKQTSTVAEWAMQHSELSNIDHAYIRIAKNMRPSLASNANVLVTLIIAKIHSNFTSVLRGLMPLSTLGR